MRRIIFGGFASGCPRLFFVKNKIIHLDSIKFTTSGLANLDQGLIREIESAHELRKINGGECTNEGCTNTGCDNDINFGCDSSDDYWG